MTRDELMLLLKVVEAITDATPRTPERDAELIDLAEKIRDYFNARELIFRELSGLDKP